MSSTTTQYHFVSKTASNFNVCLVLHLGFAVFTSIYDADISAPLAVMGLVAVLNYNVGLLFLYIMFTPASILVDIPRMITVHKHYGKGPAGFFIFVRVLEIICKMIATYFGYMVYRSASEGESGYEQINGGPSQSGVPQQQQQQNPFTPASYTAPSSTGPVLHTMPPSTTKV